jgi:hypothetical protein
MLTRASNAINGTNVYVIYAQTPKFSIGGADCTDLTPSSSTCASAATVTVTVSKTLSSSFRSNTTISGSSAGEQTTAPVTTPPSPKSTSFGTCPDTIGWGSSGYKYPVTLSSTPHPPGMTAEPSMSEETEAFAFTSTLYQTVYQPLEEGSCNC